MYITIIGIGYVGLVSCAMLSEQGHNVDCIDINTKKIELLKLGKIPIYEPGLADYLENNIKLQRIRFFDSYSQINPNTEVVFVTVDTPSDSLGNANLQNVYNAVSEVSERVNQDCLIVIKSTVPPGTAENIYNYLSNKGYNFDLGVNPEFLKQGSAVSDFLYPDRIIIGVKTKLARAKLEVIYRSFIDKNIPLIVTDTVTAEMIKYASNAFLATKVAFINEMAGLCELLGADIDLLANSMGMDHRIGKEFLKAGPGFGGSCFPKDLSALIRLAEDHNVKLQILNSVKESNYNHITNIAKKVEYVLNGVQNKKIAIWGLTFKSGTDDVRNSPAIDIAQLLVNSKAKITAYDPMGMDNARQVLKDIEYADNAIGAARDAEALLLLTEWKEFKNQDFASLKSIMAAPNVFDFRNLLDSELLLRYGYHVYSLGKKSIYKV
ncbi:MULTISPECIES: UDP-glucose dehydrogenase family protein [unclassified Wolbachia]|uniref:UDP-glucose dehydrogenase family protein n=1 Tax=unclassified Wolbachia TaxID=2640676 RepID=UPI0011072605|nr:MULTISPECIES: UDP-glucose/GDP-mannose dehydrogenase family protein [unclassified Wolbachia]MDV6248669.1 UDP-glucose/GDP-mannose dehydrogenase family protein [Wolbachia endosymbiont of Zaprionus taronus]QVU16198.1 UDP-glucose 6-dehydrogenase [Wolbachia endosymbiont of Drosophila yakuba]QVU17252.1 UDP-glucose 6-dehydrogenase [Wolbachia endosymbiont of Drosophila santomea]QWE32343.1 UDP-glucose 6-dehydrogenase [Wolbachia endosymbiont of Drosophila simulans]TLW83018.1 UDP-glucose/GDP-mannose de